MKPDAIDAALLDRNLKRNRLAVGGGVKAKAARLEKHYVKTDPGDLALCTVCDCKSPCSLSACPFCGERELADEAPAASVEVVPAARSPEQFGLDDEIAVVRDAMRGAAGNLYQMGTALKRVHDSRKWSEPDPASGLSRFAGFKQFVASEFHLGHTYAYDLIAVVERFSEADVLAFGAGKLRLMLKAPPDRQKEIRDAAEAGATREELEQRLKSLPGSPATAGRVVVGLLLRQTVTAALARPSASHVGEPKPATSIGDEPWCSIDCENGVSLVIKLVRDVGGALRFVVEAVKESAAGAAG